jgi:hypothetical protein
LKITKKTIPVIIERCRDIDANVRRTALDVISEKISIRYY